MKCITNSLKATNKKWLGQMMAGDKETFNGPNVVLFGMDRCLAFTKNTGVTANVLLLKYIHTIRDIFVWISNPYHNCTFFFLI